MLTFQLHFEGGDDILLPQIIKKNPNSSAYIQLWMQISTDLWALQNFFSLNVGNCPVTSLHSWPYLSTERGPRCGTWIGHYLVKLVVRLWVLWPQTTKHLENCMLPSNGICPDLSLGLSCDGSTSLHVQRLCLVMSDGDFSPSPTARLIHTFRLEDTLPTVTYS